MTRSTFLNLLVIGVAVAVAAVAAVPTERITEHGDPRDPEVLARLVEEAHEDFLLLDVRTAAEFSTGHIPRAVNIDYRVIQSALAETDRTRPVVLYCRTGNRSAQAAEILRAMEFSQVYDFGAVDRWPGPLLRND